MKLCFMFMDSFCLKHFSVYEEFSEIFYYYIIYFIIILYIFINVGIQIVTYSTSYSYQILTH
jgi:hypothetical protein